MGTPSLSIIAHLFYPDVALNLVEKLRALAGPATRFYINIQGDSEAHHRVKQVVLKTLPGSTILTAPNKGRDIGAKMLLIDLMLKTGPASDYTLIIHDKNSPHLENGNFWREKLFSIIRPENLAKKVFRAFESMPQAGIVGAEDFIQNEYRKPTDDFSCSSSKKLKEIISKFDIRTRDFDFVAGNIFWIRTSLLAGFFASRSIPEIRKQLESGNVLDFKSGTYVHSWERAMSWIATSQGYHIHGI